MDYNDLKNELEFGLFTGEAQELLRDNGLSGSVRNQLRERYTSHDWWETKEQIFRERGRRCERCQSKDNIHVHHRTYKNLGHEPPEDLEILCRDCHQREHIFWRFEKWLAIMDLPPYCTKGLKVPSSEIDFGHSTLTRFRNAMRKKRGLK